ncbi:MAG: hypothetical protein ACKO2Z_12020, partial [Sphaerospermopsis kisseleviana]
LCITSSITFISQFCQQSTSDRKAQVIDKRSPLSPLTHQKRSPKNLTGGQEGEKAYVVRDTECGSKKR